MPWARTSPVEERTRFITDHRAGVYSMTELCERYGVSRKTGYKWVRRFEEVGLAGLEDRPRAPIRCPHQMDPEIATAIVGARELHPSWGARKLIAWLERKFPHESWPAASSVGELLRREGLTRPRKKRRKRMDAVRPDVNAHEANAVWTADFKGQFHTRNGDCCFPLTVADLFSRYVLEIRGLGSTRTEGVAPAFERVFREVGLPDAILTDNGAPFAAPRGLLGLSRLGVWWLRLGIELIRIQPGHPEQNGVHERMHRTLKAETAKPAAGNLGAQQRSFNRFRRIYNEERPHEALGQQPPATRWQPSPRAFPDSLPGPEYPGYFERRLVSDAGAIRKHSTPVYLSSALSGQWVGLDEIDDGVWEVHFCRVTLGRFNRTDFKLHPGTPT